MRRFLTAAALLVVSCLATGAASAQSAQPSEAFNFRFGWFFPTGHGDFWDSIQSSYTLDHSDFNGPMGGVGYTAAISNYFEFDSNIDFYTRGVTSADRFFVDQFGNPPLHDTRLSLSPLTVGIRVLPTGRYAQRGEKGRHLVRHPVPYIGAGIGAVYWQYEEEGDFVFVDPSVPEGFSIFYDRVKDSGLEFETHAYAGIEFPVAPDWNITFEARHSWAEATPDSRFTGSPDKLDLGGTTMYFGAAVRF